VLQVIVKLSYITREII